MMHKHLVLVFFRLLIFMYTLCDPWDVNFEFWNFAINRLCASIGAKGVAMFPFSKKKID
jgi:hypothetical protein